MIIGHVGVAFAARGRWPRLSLGWLLVATFAPDLLRQALQLAAIPWPVATLYSHLLPWSLILAAALGAAAWLTGGGWCSGSVVAALVLSHIALDMVSGFKELWLGGPAGLDLQRYMQLEFGIEAALAWAGWYAMRRRAGSYWASSRQVLASLLIVQAAYLTRTFRERPYATRCIEFPLRPCWIRRRDPPPAAY
jgi:hypothetical protein